MPKPAGAIDTGDIGEYEIISDVTHWFYYGHRVEQAIAEWALTDLDTLFARFRSCVTVDAGDSVTINYQGGAGSTEVRAGALNRAWSGDWVLLNKSLATSPDGFPIGNPDPHVTKPPRMRRGAISVTPSKAAKVTIHAFMIEIYHGGLLAEVPYASNLPATAIDNAGVEVLAEPLDHSGVSPELYAPGMPVSSWLMRSAMCATMNRLAYQARLCFSWPVFRPAYPP